MKYIKLFILILFCIFSFSACVFNQNDYDPTVDMTPRQIRAESGLDTIQVVENVKGAVVGIACFSSSGSVVGSGVAIAEDGYILTNNHVVYGANSILLYYADKSQGTATKVWNDASLDLAIIKANKDMPYMQCGNSNDLKVGQEVIAIGTPLTLQFKHTVTKGIISALNRTLEVGSLTDATYLQNLIQHDASINPGNSGGPLITLDCKLVGINTLKAESGEGIAFAIPIEAGEAISQQVVANQVAEPAYIGVFGFDAQIASFHNETTAENGVYIVTVEKESPADKAGIVIGDVVVGVGDSEIKTVMNLRIALYSYTENEPITLKILRDGKEILFEMNAGKRAS